MCPPAASSSHISKQIKRLFKIKSLATWKIKKIQVINQHIAGIIQTSFEPVFVDIKGFVHNSHARAVPFCCIQKFF